MLDCALDWDAKKATPKDWVMFALAGLVGLLGIIPGGLGVRERNVAGESAAAEIATVVGGVLAIVLAVVQLAFAFELQVKPNGVH